MSTMSRVALSSKVVPRGWPLMIPRFAPLMPPKALVLPEESVWFWKRVIGAMPLPVGGIRTTESSLRFGWTRLRVTARSLTLRNLGSAMLTWMGKSVTAGRLVLLGPTAASLIGPGAAGKTAAVPPSVIRSVFSRVVGGLAVARVPASTQATVSCPGAVVPSAVPWLTVRVGWLLRALVKLPPSEMGAGLV